ncbi:CP12 domain protein [Prochlorococcus marinus str. MIT 1342]|nr:CP12 domain protein [Prochlorococcus marinus str. MIT 1342]
MAVIEAGAGQDPMKTIDEHIQKDQSEIQDAKAQGNDAKVRHLTDEIHSLEEYKDHHPEDKHDPNALELFCDANPDEPECRVYDD